MHRNPFWGTSANFHDGHSPGNSVTFPQLLWHSYSCCIPAYINVTAMSTLQMSVPVLQKLSQWLNEWLKLKRPAKTGVAPYVKFSNKQFSWIRFFPFTPPRRMVNSIIFPQQLTISMTFLRSRDKCSRWTSISHQEGRRNKTSAGEMSEISTRMDIDAIFPMTLQCGCDADVRIILGRLHSTSDKTTYTPTEIGVSDVRMWLHVASHLPFAHPLFPRHHCLHVVIYRGKCGKTVLPCNDCSHG